jgi:hypothetical protein
LLILLLGVWTIPETSVSTSTPHDTSNSNSKKTNSIHSSIFVSNHTSAPDRDPSAIEPMLDSEEQELLTLANESVPTNVTRLRYPQSVEQSNRWRVHWK